MPATPIHALTHRAYVAGCGCLSDVVVAGLLTGQAAGHEPDHRDLDEVGTLRACWPVGLTFIGPGTAGLAFGARAQRTTRIDMVSGSWAAAALARGTARDGRQLLSPSRVISSGRS
jgi:hypothetical protein